ncbi:MAG: hypothetical protein Q8L29_00115 [archaeon]|nr:hypothetical protein [archaeon]
MKMLRNLGLAGILAGSMFIEGCVEPQAVNGRQQETLSSVQQREDNSDIAAVGGLLLGLAGINASTPQQAAGLGLLSNAANRYSDRQNNLAAAELGRTQVNVNVNPQNNQQQAGQPYRNPISGGRTSYSVAFNYYEDSNRDGINELTEMKGISDRFDLAKEKTISFASAFDNMKGKIGMMRLYDSEGRLIKESGRLIEGNNWVIDNLGFDANELRKAGANGRCVVNWAVDGKVVDAYYVTFTDSSPQIQDSPREQEVEKKNPLSTAFNYWQDINNDGSVSGEELKGRGNRFSLSREKMIRFGTLVQNGKGKTLDFYLYGPNNRVVIRDSVEVDSEKAFMYFKISEESLKNITARGKCTANFRIRDADQEKTDARVCDSYDVTLDE